jgi:serine/threonine-protein phosphatase 2A activator
MIDPPALITNSKFVERMRDNNLFLGAIDFISQVKQGPFNEHSPMLYDISGVPYWHKVNKGLQKMYVDEVLRKFPVVQHLVFGNLFSFEINNNNQ